MSTINTIATIARPRTLVESFVANPVGSHYATTAPVVATTSGAGMRGTDLRDVGTKQGSPPRGNPR